MEVNKIKTLQMSVMQYALNLNTAAATELLKDQP